MSNSTQKQAISDSETFFFPANHLTWQPNGETKPNIRKADMLCTNKTKNTMT